MVAEDGWTRLRCAPSSSMMVSSSRSAPPGGTDKAASLNGPSPVLDLANFGGEKLIRSIGWLGGLAKATWTLGSGDCWRGGLAKVRKLGLFPVRRLWGEWDRSCCAPLKNQEKLAQGCHLDSGQTPAHSEHMSMLQPKCWIPWIQNSLPYWLRIQQVQLPHH